MSEFTLTLSQIEIDGVIAGLGELPTKTNAFMLLMKIQSQIEAQMQQTKDTPTEG
jgi:hypothetical protein